MKTTKTIQTPVMGGTAPVKVTVTDEHRGCRLGASIQPGDVIHEQPTDHIESETPVTMRFDFGECRKDRIASLEWHDDGFGATVRRVRFAMPDGGK